MSLLLLFKGYVTPPTTARVTQGLVEPILEEVGALRGTQLVVEQQYEAGGVRGTQLTVEQQYEAGGVRVSQLCVELYYLAPTGRRFRAQVMG